MIKSKRRLRSRLWKVDRSWWDKKIVGISYKKRCWIDWRIFAGKHYKNLVCDDIVVQENSDTKLTIQT
jgi:hypothetical protein